MFRIKNITKIKLTHFQQDQTTSRITARADKGRFDGQNLSATGLMLPRSFRANFRYTDRYCGLSPRELQSKQAGRNRDRLQNFI